MAVIYSSDVRELWAEEILNDSVVDGSFDSGTSLLRTRAGGRTETQTGRRRRAILAVIEACPAGVAKRRRAAADVS
jgi:hypothetical protein